MELAQKLHGGLKLPEGTPATLDVDHVVNEPVPSAFPNGCHVAEVEIDPETGHVQVVHYSAVNDFGTVINPLLVEGQIQGGVVQGLGQALLEQAVYDSDGQLVTGSFMDYAMPRAHDAPMIAVASHPVPTKSNPLGAKGCGEAGCSGGLPSVANAVIDALSDYGIRHLDMPMTPARVWQAIEDAKRQAAGKAAGKTTSMSQATEVLGAKPASHTRLVGVVSAAHFVSHYYIILLAPLLPFVRADYGVSYTEIGLALAAFNIVSAALQTPAGFLVDRIGARILLIVGAAVRRLRLPGRRPRSTRSGCWSRCSRVAGIGNTVYHPADYALLSHHVPAERIGQAFSVHTFAGMLGSARGAADAADDAEPVGLARRLHRRRRARLCRRGRADRVLREQPAERPACRRAPSPMATRRPAGGCCCRRRSCSISFSSCCSR